MKTYTILIGNSDNKLKQVAWADFVAGLAAIVKDFATTIHFSGSSPAKNGRSNLLTRSNGLLSFFK